MKSLLKVEKKMKLENVPRGHNLSLDGGVLIALVTKNRPKQVEELVGKLLDESVKGVTHSLATTELLYILCRKVGWEKAFERFQDFQQSKICYIVETAILQPIIARIKCQRTLAIADCFTLALAEQMQCPAVFDVLEREIKRAHSIFPITTTTVFLDDQELQ